MIDLTAFGAALAPGEEGCWFARDDVSSVSYPAEGNDLCFSLEDDSFWFQHRSECIVRLVRAYPPGGAVFDVGGGNGAVAAALERAGIPVVLVEPGRRGALNARQRGCPNVVCATLEQAGFAPASLPAVGLFDVLEHIEEDRAFLEYVFSRLVRGGRLYLTVPAHAALWSAEDEYAGHFRRYTLATLRRTLKAAGFTTDFRSYLFWFLPLPIFLLRTVPTWFGRRPPGGAPQTRREHGRGGGWKGALLDRCLSLERRALAQGRPVSFGSSCLVAARRPG
jgi:SAM-dependent methyltransferase